MKPSSRKAYVAFVTSLATLVAARYGLVDAPPPETFAQVAAEAGAALAGAAATAVLTWFVPNKPKGLQASILSVLGAAAVALLLAGCVGGQFSSGEAADKLGDSRIVEAETPEERVTRALAVAAIISELAEDRLRIAPETAQEVLARLDSLSGAMTLLEEEGGSLWVNTALSDMRRVLYKVIGEEGEERIDSLLGGIPSVDQAFAFAARYGKFTSMRDDIRVMFEELRAETLTHQEVRAAIRERFDRNYGRVEEWARLVGGVEG